MENQARGILSAHFLKQTSNRILLLNYFLENNTKSYTAIQLIEVLANQMDRVTVYRTLNSFFETKIVTRISNTDGQAGYLLSDNLMRKKDSEIHPRMLCNECNNISELPELPSNYLNALKDFRIENIILEGVCVNCF